MSFEKMETIGMSTSTLSRSTLIRVYQTKQFETSSNDKKNKKSPVIIHRCLRPLHQMTQRSCKTCGGTAGGTAGVVFFCRRGGTSNPLHGNDSDSRYELATPRGIGAGST